MQLPSRAPHPALSDHPEFAIMLAVTLDRYHCTLAELRQDYWLGRAWRALVGDPVLAGRVARLGLGHILLTGPGHTPLRMGPRDREGLRSYALERLMADTAHTAEQLDLAIEFADRRVEVADGCVLSILAQTIVGDPRWQDLRAYGGDLAPIVVPVAMASGATVAA